MLEQGILGAGDAERRANVTRMVLVKLAEKQNASKHGERFIGAARTSSESAPSVDGFLARVERG